MLDETLRVSRDLCTGIGAFFISASGELRTTLPEDGSADETIARFRDLAQSCLTHPAVRDRALFATAEITEEVDAVERSLACLALPIWSGDAKLGVLGVADTWLPELDDEQRAGLISLGQNLALELESLGAVEAFRAYQQGPAVSTQEQPEPIEAESELEEVETQEIEAYSFDAETELPEIRTLVIPHGEAIEVSDGEIVDDSAGPDHHETFLGEVLDHLPDGLLVTRADGAVVMVNQAFAQMTGLPIDDLLGEDAGQIVSTGEYLTAEATAVPTAERTETLLSALGHAQSGRNLLVSSVGGDPVVTEPSGARLLSRYAGECTVTLLREAAATESLLHSHGDRLSAVLDELEDGVICCDEEGIVLVANTAARLLQGLPAGRALVGLPFSGVTSLQTTGGAPLAPEAHPLLQALRDGITHTTHLRLATGEHHQRHLAVSARPLQLENGRRGAIAVLRDMTAEWTEQEQLAHYALHDPLTGLANRYLFSAELERMLKGLARRGGSVALVFMDLNGFKRINDEFGHSVGDELLRAIGRRLQGAVRSDDVIARLGGDEFVIAHNSASSLSDGDSIVARIRKVLLAPYLVDGKVFDVRVSIGWVSTASAEVTAEKLLDEADKAMYGEKRQRGTEA
jgi:diguanylate cyclase (GGDEF)-like protein